MHGTGSSGLLVLEENYFFLISSWTSLFSIHGLIGLLVVTIYTGQTLRQVPFCLGRGKFLEVFLSRVSPRFWLY